MREREREQGEEGRVYMETKKGAESDGIKRESDSDGRHVDRNGKRKKKGLEMSPSSCPGGNKGAPSLPTTPPQSISVGVHYSHFAPPLIIITIIGHNYRFTA